MQYVDTYRGMGLMERVRTLVGFEEQTYRYECTNCESTFESPHADMSRISCPNCAATRVRSVRTRW